MSEIQRSDARPGPDADAGADRDAKIEQLLLVGLDHYFAAQYEQAINVWTRALFLDRNHPRARAYIDRARGALAERQRESEELLHNGVAAFQRGEGDEARRLLQAAIESGAPSDEALAVLERIDRLSIPQAAASGDMPARTSRGARHAGRPVVGVGSSRSLTLAVVLAAAGTGAVVYAAATGSLEWPPNPFVEPAGTPPAPLVQDLSLPLPRRGEMALADARALAAAGRLHEALGALDQVRATDAQRDEAARLRADIQRQLLALTPMPAPPSDRPVP